MKKAHLTIAVAAFKHGQEAFHVGIKSAPCLDKKMDAIIVAANAEGGHKLVISVMKAWGQAWHQENLRAPLEA